MVFINLTLREIIKKQSWIVDLKNGAGSISVGAGNHDCLLTLSDDDFVLLMTGKLKAQTAFTQQKLRVKGNMGLAMKLQELIKQDQAKL